ncbi:hypothetical protein DQ384_04530 [Sphaerisporangium album]|uniref:Uncharacterized protein n=1 Tax=Sphaerisporangium album TaxID=509200 RepID=A0A367FQR9_9ACTN|nr:hypothetical protein DQ384_04530 [Sphaerisporangium album]
MRRRDLYLIVAAVSCVLVAFGAVAFNWVKGGLDVMMERPDPACVARSEAENERLAQAVARYLPSVNPDEIERGHSCGPPESGSPWIETELPRTSIDETLRGFRPPHWTAVPADEAQKQADPGQVAAAVTGEVDHRKVEVYAIQVKPRTGPLRGPVKIIAWFVMA